MKTPDLTPGYHVLAVLWFLRGLINPGLIAEIHKESEGKRGFC